jgi:hypothetical protein
VLGRRGAGSLRAAFRGVGVLGVERGGWGRMLPGAAPFLRWAFGGWFFGVVFRREAFWGGVGGLSSRFAFLGGNRSGGAGRRRVTGGVGGIS